MLLSEIVDTEPDTETDWWPGRLIPGDVVLWVGKKKIGKGLVLEGDLTARKTMGWPPPPVDPSDPSLDQSDWPMPAYVILIAPEDKAKTLRDRVIAHHGNPALVEVMSQVKRAAASGVSTQDDFSINTDLGLLDAKVHELTERVCHCAGRAHRNFTGPCTDCGMEDQLLDVERRCPPCADLFVAKGGHDVGDGHRHGVGLVIFDPLTAVCTSTISYNQQVRGKIIRPAQKFAEKSGLEVAIAGHFTKGIDKITANSSISSIEDYVGGSEGILAGLRLCVVMMEDPQSPGSVKIMTLTSNIGYPDDEIKYRVVAHGVNDPDAHVEWMQAPVPVSDEAGWARIEQRLLDLMVAEGQPLSYSQLAVLSGYTFDVVQQAIGRGRRDGLFTRSHKAWIPGSNAITAAGRPAITAGTDRKTTARAAAQRRTQARRAAK